jgi:hypothetical protein
LLGGWGEEVLEDTKTGIEVGGEVHHNNGEMRCLATLVMKIIVEGGQKIRGSIGRHEDTSLEERQVA